jgi:hypothetical protein
MSETEGGGKKGESGKVPRPPEGKKCEAIKEVLG